MVLKTENLNIHYFIFKKLTHNQFVKSQIQKFVAIKLFICVI